MTFSGLDYIVFMSFIIAVVSVGLFKSKSDDNSEKKGSENYFLAGRGLKWWLIGFSLIAANISTEQFVGMSGAAAGSLGLAIASYEWMAAVTLVVTAFFFLPKFLRSGIYTIPEFLEYRYNAAARSIMAGFTMIIYVGVTISAVIYSGALTINTLFAGKSLLGIPITVGTASWIIGIIAAVYVAAGGLKACAWADLLQGSALILGGAIVVILAINKLGDTPVALLASNIDPQGLSDGAGGITKFFALNSDKLHMVLPKNNPDIPWTALVLGLWIPNFYYWGLNQYITQRTLGAKSLAEGQKGIVFAAALKLIIPFIIVVPGIVAFNLFSADMATEAANDKGIAANNQAIIQEFEQIRSNPADNKHIVFMFDKGFIQTHPDKAAELSTYNENTMASAKAAGVEPVKRQLMGYKYDSAFALLIAKLVPSGLQGFLLAAILGAVISSLASMLNSASTIFTMDLYHKYANKNASQTVLVRIGRICTVTFVAIGCLISPLLANPNFGGVFKYIQEFQGYISPGILAVFVFGLIIKKAPAAAGVTGLLINPVLYGLLAMVFPSMAFLDRMAAAFFCNLLVMAVITMIKPLPVPVNMPVIENMNLESSKLAKFAGIGVCVMTVILYIIFW